jgi:hypothetical protein
MSLANITQLHKRSCLLAYHFGSYVEAVREENFHHHRHLSHHALIYYFNVNNDRSVSDAWECKSIVSCSVQCSVHHTRCGDCDFWFVLPEPPLSLY